MRSLFIFALFILTVVSCEEKKSERPDHNQDIEVKLNAEPASSRISLDGIYFRANGNEPFWSLEMSDQIIRLKTPTDSLLIPSSSPVRSDSSMIQYRLETEKSIIHIDIVPQECIHSMSGHKSPYVVNISYRLTSEKDLKSVNGCGQYHTDYRLHDIWILESLESIDLDHNETGEKLTSLEINAHKNTFTGFTGCNRMNGQLEYRHGIIRLQRIATTRRYCPNSSLTETTLLDYLKQWNNYTIANNRLILKQGDQEKAIFRKID